jgi:hypothetical protein
MLLLAPEMAIPTGIRIGTSNSMIRSRSSEVACGAKEERALLKAQIL